VISFGSTTRLRVMSVTVRTAAPIDQADSRAASGGGAVLDLEHLERVHRIPSAGHGICQLARSTRRRGQAAPIRQACRPPEPGTGIVCVSSDHSVPGCFGGSSPSRPPCSSPHSARSCTTIWAARGIGASAVAVADVVAGRTTEGGGPTHRGHGRISGVHRGEADW
jgi:hypothetical protein